MIDCKKHLKYDVVFKKVLGRLFFYEKNVLEVRNLHYTLLFEVIKECVIPLVYWFLMYRDFAGSVSEEFPSETEVQGWMVVIR